MKRLQEFFNAEHNREPLIPLMRIDRFIRAHEGNGAYGQVGSDGTKKSNSTRNIIMITSGIGILAAALIGFLSWNSGDVRNHASKAYRTTSGERVAGSIEPMKEGGDGTLSSTGERVGSDNQVLDLNTEIVSGKAEGKKPNDDQGKEERDSNGLFVTSAPFISGLRMIELTREELGRLGLQPDTAGVWYFRDAGETVSGLQITMRGAQLIMEGDKDPRKEGTAAPTFEPIFITDDFGNRRLERLDDGVWQKRDKEVEEEVRRIEESMGRTLESEERFKLAEDVQARLSEQRLATGNFIPVIVRTGHSYTEEDRANRRWRPDCVFWYEPTREFLTALPDRVRLSLERELRLASVLQGKPDHESMEAFIRRQPLEVRDAFDSLKSESSGSSDVARGTSPLKSESGGSSDVARGTSPLKSESGGSSVAAVAGEAIIGIFNAASGAITSSSVAPNPARDRTVLRYRLEAPRTVSLALYDVRGSLIKTFDKSGSQNAGEHLYPVDLKGVPPGIYLLAISTEKERAIQRVIVE